MFVTTSRKPGNRTRTFAKLFSRFLNLEYLPRGKKGLDYFPGNYIVIEEKEGNPHVIRLIKKKSKVLKADLGKSEINKLGKTGLSLKSEVIIKFNIQEMDTSLELDSGPVVFEEKSYPIPFFDFSDIGAISSKIPINFEPRKKIFFRKQKNHFFVHFKFGRKNVFRIKILSITEQ